MLAGVFDHPFDHNVKAYYVRYDTGCDFSNVFYAAERFGVSH